MNITPSSLGLPSSYRRTAQIEFAPTMGNFITIAAFSSNVAGHATAFAKFAHSSTLQVAEEISRKDYATLVRQYAELASR